MSLVNLGREVDLTGCLFGYVVALYPQNARLFQSLKKHFDVIKQLNAKKQLTVFDVGFIVFDLIVEL